LNNRLLFIVGVSLHFTLHQHRTHCFAIQSKVRERPGRSSVTDRSE